MKRQAALTVKADPGRVSVAGLIRAAAEAAPLLVVTGRALTDLADELGGFEQAAEYLHQVAQETGRPIGVNLPVSPDASTTVFIAPRAWTEERLQGWAAGHH